MRIAQKIVLTPEDRQTLERWSRGRSTQARLVLRARIMLLAADGGDNKTIAAELDTDRMLVGRWRQRFAQCGLAGIEKDEGMIRLHKDNPAYKPIYCRREDIQSVAVAVERREKL